MNESSSLGKLAEALAKAQGEMQNAEKNQTNPFFDSVFADLASVWDACRQPLSRNGLSVVQSIAPLEGGRMVLKTRLIHASGEWIESILPLQPAKSDPQSLGSAITYMRRFALSALVGIAPAEAPTKEDTDDEDDGNAASGRSSMPPQVIPQSNRVIVPKSIPQDSKDLESQKLRSDIRSLVIERNLPNEQVSAYILENFGAKSSKDLRLDQLKLLQSWIMSQNGKPVDVSPEFLQELQAMEKDPRANLK